MKRVYFKIIRKINSPIYVKMDYIKTWNELGHRTWIGIWLKVVSKIKTQVIKKEASIVETLY